MKEKERAREKKGKYGREDMEGNGKKIWEILVDKEGKGSSKIKCKRGREWKRTTGTKE